MMTGGSHRLFRRQVHLLDEIGGVICRSVVSLWWKDDVRAPLITATYVAVLALLYAVLSLQVVRLRRRNRVGFGDGGNTRPSWCDPCARAFCRIRANNCAN